MAGVSDQELAVGRVYSTAMLELAQAQGDVDVLLRELNDFTDAVAHSAEFQTFVTDPTIDPKARARSLDHLFRGKYSDLFVDSLQVLNRKGRLGLIAAVAEGYRAARDELQGRVRVYVKTAAPLTDALRDKIRDVAARRTGKQADLVESVDQALIGGLVLQIGDQKLDASVATKLKKLSDAFLERASREIRSERSHLEGAGS